jgi:hypothetical protein
MKPNQERHFVTALALAALSAGAWAETPARPLQPPRTRRRRTSTFRSHRCGCPGSERCSGRAATPDRAAQQQLQRQQDQQAAAESASKADSKPVSQQQWPSSPLRLAVQQETAIPCRQPARTVAQCEPNGGPARTIHFKGINITPGGYAAAEFVRRSRALSADLPTPFQFADHAGSLAEPGVGVFRLRPPV